MRSTGATADSDGGDQEDGIQRSATKLQSHGVAQHRLDKHQYLSLMGKIVGGTVDGSTPGAAEFVAIRNKEKVKQRKEAQLARNMPLLGYSFGIMSPTNPVRLALSKVVRRSVFDSFILACIILYVPETMIEVSVSVEDLMIHQKIAQYLFYERNSEEKAEKQVRRIAESKPASSCCIFYLS